MLPMHIRKRVMPRRNWVKIVMRTSQMILTNMGRIILGATRVSWKI